MDDNGHADKNPSALKRLAIRYFHLELGWNDQKLQAVGDSFTDKIMGWAAANEGCHFMLVESGR